MVLLLYNVIRFKCTQPNSVQMLYVQDCTWWKNYFTLCMGFRIFCKVYNMYFLELFFGGISSVFKKTWNVTVFLVSKSACNLILYLNLNLEQCFLSNFVVGRGGALKKVIRYCSGAARFSYTTGFEIAYNFRSYAEAVVELSKQILGLLE